jgi:hypothetical protein
MLREKTLRHLLLVVGRSLQRTPGNEKISEVIHEVCETLVVEREKRGPYRLKWGDGTALKSLEVDAARFRFHERGDVVNQIDRRTDLPSGRLHNWTEAINVWRELLEQKDLVTDTSLAPKQIKTTIVSLIKHDKIRVAFVIVCSTIATWLDAGWLLGITLAIAVPVTQQYPHRLTIALAATLAYQVINNQSEQLLVILILLSVLSFTMAVRPSLLAPIASVSFLIPIIFSHKLWIVILPFAILELASAISQRNLMGLTIYSVTLIVVAIYAFSFEVPELEFGALSLIAVMIAVAVVTLSFTYTVDPSMIRISAPLSLGLSTCYKDVNSVVVVVTLVTWLVLLLWPKPQRSQSQIALIIPTSTPVQLRPR